MSRALDQSDGEVAGSSPGRVGYCFLLVSCFLNEENVFER
jgi:hypothetical protein